MRVGGRLHFTLSSRDDVGEGVFKLFSLITEKGGDFGYDYKISPIFTEIIPFPSFFYNIPNSSQFWRVVIVLLLT